MTGAGEVKGKEVGQEEEKEVQVTKHSAKQNLMAKEQLCST